MNSESSPALLGQLIEALRQELQQYGEILALLEQQQQAVVSRAADDVVQAALAIPLQLEAIGTARQTRTQLQAELGQQLKLPAPVNFSALVPALPEKYRGAVHALVSENNQLLVRVQQRARQNHILLSRSLELMQEFIAALVPATPRMYNGDGQMSGVKIASHSLEVLG